MRTTPLLLLLLAAPVAAQKIDPELTTQKIRDGLYVISGSGGNVAVGVGKDAVYLIDDELEPLSARLKAELAKLTDKPVRFVVNTHWHDDHTGNNKMLGEAGAVILAHDNVRKRLSAPQVIEIFNKKVPASPPVALPVITFAESVTLHLNGDDLEVIHVAPAHTDGDSLVWFRKADVLHLGDLFMTIGYPFVDRQSGGSYDGFIAAADRALGIAGPNTRIIPGHGVVTDRARLKIWRDLLVTVRERVKKLVDAGKTQAEVRATHPTAEFDADWGKGFIKPDMLVDSLWTELKNK